VTLSPGTATVAVGATVQLQAQLYASNDQVMTGSPVTWTSSSPAASVTGQGLVLGLSAGSATISAASGGVSGTAQVTVVAPVASVDVSPADTSIVLGASVRLTATVRGSDGGVLTGRAVTWSADPASVVTVSSEGVVRTWSQGQATVSATSEGKSGSAAVTVQMLTVEGPKITFNSDRDGNFEIYLMDPDGSNPINLTRHPGTDIHPTWSPDGSRIAFASDRSGNDNFEIYSMNADGTDVVRLTNFAGWDLFPSWSGTKIAFERWLDTLEEGALEIFVMNEDGTGPVNVTNNVDFARAPSLSSDGGRIVFQTDRDFDVDFTEIDPEIFVMNADGTDPVNLTNTDEAFDGLPEWSPDGSRIAFQSNRTGAGGDGAGDTEVFVMDADGSNVVKVTRGGCAAWSPDGSHLVICRDRHIYSIAVDGTDLKRLTDHPFEDAWPAWRP